MREGGGWSAVYVTRILILSPSSPPPPHTHTVPCPTLPPIEHGSMNPPSNSPGVTVTLTCDDGYTLQGTGSISCAVTGEWSGSLGTCEESRRGMETEREGGRT